MKFGLRGIAAAAGATAALVLISTAATSANAAPQDDSPAPPKTSAQSRISSYLKEVSNGTQVSDNAVSFDGGKVVMVFPDQGQSKAPSGLGRNVRSDAPSSLKTMSASESTTQAAAATTVNGCTSTWYCFFEHANYGGRRLQFRDTCYGWMANYGFDNQTTSWVNDVSWKRVYAYNSSTYSGLLWSEGRGPDENPNVGSAANDRLTSWTTDDLNCSS